MKYPEVVSLVNKILDEYDQATIRQIYYRLVSPPYQYMDNTRSMYCSFDGMLTKAREDGEVNCFSSTLKAQEYLIKQVKN